MKISKKLSYISLPVSFAIAVFVCGNAVYAKGAQHAVAETYGLTSFDRIEKIRFTFNVKVGDKHVVRSWIWQPGSGQVSFSGKDKTSEPVVYNRITMGRTPSETLKKIDRQFINDQYWLLFPLHLAWDDKATIEDTGRHKLPMGDGSGRRLVVTYPPTGGYTPGDVYEIFIDDDNRFTHWIYRRGGATENPKAMTWEDHKWAGPLMISTKHKGKSGNIHLYFTDVAVQLAGSDEWIEAR
jgi:hypothetical protein